MVPLREALASAEVFVDGDWVESKDQDPEGDVRLIQLADVGDGEYIDKSDRFLTSDKAQALRCTFLQPGDVLVARMPDPIGRACIFPGDSKPSVTVVDVCIIRPDPQKHDARWLMHCLNGPACRNQIAGYATGTTRSRISRGNLGKIRIPLPPLAEQQRIAEILDKVDALRARRRSALTQVDTFIQSMFLTMFGDPRTNPKQWSKEDLGELLNIEWGNTSITKDSYVVEGVPAYSASGQDGFLPHAEHDGEGIVLSAIGARCGRCFYVPGGSWTAIKNTITMRPKPASRVAFQYVMRLVNDERFWRNRGAGQPFITLGTARSQSIPVPAKELQEEFARRVQQVERLRAAEIHSLSELDTLFASLHHRAFRGEL